MNKNDFIVSYTISCNDEEMLKELEYSIKSVLKFINRENIRVIITPPLEEDVIEKLNEICIPIIRTYHIDEPYSAHPFNYEEVRPYGDKLFIRDIECKNVVFLDCDTYFYTHPYNLFKDDFDFGGLPMDKYPYTWQSIGGYIYSLKDEYKYLPMNNFHLWDGGTLIFKNNTHKSISKEWERVLKNEKDLLINGMSFKRITYDQTSLTPVIAKSNLKIKEFNDNEIIKTKKGWEKRITDDTIIIHGKKLSEKIPHGIKNR